MENDNEYYNKSAQNQNNNQKTKVKKWNQIKQLEKIQMGNI